MHSFNWNPREYGLLMANLMDTEPFNPGSWQSMDVSASKVHDVHELMDVTLVVPSLLMPTTASGMVRKFGPDLPWADEHFAERVSGHPYNPPPSAARWPYAVRGHDDHTTCPTCGAVRVPPATPGHVHVCTNSFHDGNVMGMFDHTYPERFWPKHAGPAHPHSLGDGIEDVCGGTPGVRFHYGDLSDVIALLVRDRHTRQAYLPIWFPEDTGPESHQRVPCTLGYHFMIRNGALTMRYYLRSCDVYRHLRNDMYFAARLGLYVSDAVTEASGFTVRPGRLLTHISSLHMFVNDERHIRHQAGTNHQDHGTAQFPASCESCRMETTALGTVTIDGI